MLRNKKEFMSFIYWFATGWKEVFENGLVLKPGFHQEFQQQEKGVTLWENTVKEAPYLNRKQSQAIACQPDNSVQ